MPTGGIVAGQVFNRLTAVSIASISGYTVKWLFRCSCGNEKIALSSNVKNGKTKSCGCFHKEQTSASNRTHGKSQTALFNVWNHMIGRCYTPTNSAFKHYGARGITVCAEWRNFQTFESWAIASGYDGKLTLDRIDNDQGYSPENCRWADSYTQSRNRRGLRKVTVGDKVVCAKEASDLTGVPYWKVLATGVAA